jgi:endonuclease/exonuclease/phosphatase family metal-dependent hydrolase
MFDAWVAAGHAETEGITYPDDGRFGDLKLDYCFVSAALAGRVKGAWIDGAADGSDHQPVWTELEP